MARSQQVDGKVERWTARRWVGGAVRQAHAAAVARRARGAKAMAPIAALPQRGRGQKRLETGAA